MFAKKLRDLRKQKDVTQIALAQELGLSQQTVARWESGNATPPIDTISRMAKFFGVPAAYFVGEASDNANLMSADDEERELTERQIKSIVDIISLFEVRTPARGVTELSSDYCGTVERVLRENDEIMTHTFNALTLVLDALIIGSLELAKINLNRAIAGISKEFFGSEDAVRKARERVAEKIAPSAVLLSNIMNALPEAFFKESSSESATESGDPDGEH